MDVIDHINSQENLFLTTHTMLAVKNMPKDLVTWYSPRIVWFEKAARPQRIEHRFYKTKEEYTTNFGKVVLDWETIQAPKNWEGCQ